MNKKVKLTLIISPVILIFLYFFERKTLRTTYPNMKQPKLWGRRQRRKPVNYNLEPKIQKNQATTQIQTEPNNIKAALRPPPPRSAAFAKRVYPPPPAGELGVF